MYIHTYLYIHGARVYVLCGFDSLRLNSENKLQNAVEQWPKPLLIGYDRSYSTYFLVVGCSEFLGCGSYPLVIKHGTAKSKSLNYCPIERLIHHGFPAGHVWRPQGRLSAAKVTIHHLEIDDSETQAFCQDGSQQSFWHILSRHMGVSINGLTPIAGWFLSWKIPI